MLTLNQSFRSFLESSELKGLEIVNYKDPQSIYIGQCGGGGDDGVPQCLSIFWKVRVTALKSYVICTGDEDIAPTFHQNMWLVACSGRSLSEF